MELMPPAMKKAKAMKGGGSKKSRLDSVNDELDGTWALMAPYINLATGSQGIVDQIQQFKQELQLDSKAAIRNRLLAMQSVQLKELSKQLDSHCEETRLQALTEVFFVNQMVIVNRTDKVVSGLKRCLRSATALGVFSVYMSDDGRTSWDSIKTDITDAIEDIARGPRQQQ